MSYCRNTKRVWTLIVALVFIVVAFPMSTFAKTEAEMKTELSDLQKKQSSLNNSISSLDGDIDQQVARYEEYNKILLNVKEQIAIYSEQIDELQAKMDIKDMEIEAKNQEIVTKEEDFKRSNEQFKQRLAAMYKTSGDSSTLNILFGAESFSDFLTQTEALKNISDNDRKLMNRIVEQRIELEALRTQLQTVKNELQTQQTEKLGLKAEQDAKAAEQQSLRDQAAALQQQLKAQKSNLEEEAANLAASEAEISRMIAEAEALRLQQEEAARKAAEEAGNNNGAGAGGSGGSGGGITGGDNGGNVSASGWKWPVPNYSRFSQAYGSGHTGIDIAASEGVAIIAAQAGTVVFAGQTAYGGGFGGYGNCVLLSHGGGLYTLYAHASVLNVSAGQSVTRGQTIAGVGNTGNSFGNHLHFEVRTGAQGSRLNPLNYVTEPR